MESDALVGETRNLTGAIIFTAYVIAALLLTALLSRDLVNAYLYLPKSLRNQDGLHKQLQAVAGLCVMSFSVLSYHMMDYLIESYQTWANNRGIALPYQLCGKMGLLGSEQQRAPLYIWTWLKTSTLFQNFAQTIVVPSEHFWWTQQALLVTMAWSVFMSIEGRFLSCWGCLPYQA